MMFMWEGSSVVGEGRVGDVSKGYRVLTFVSLPLRISSVHCRSAVNLVEDLTTGATIQHMHLATQSKPTSCKPLPIQQQVAACTLLLLYTNQKDLTLGTVYEKYCAVCNQRKLVGVSEAEFVGVVELLEVRGVVSVKRTAKKPSRFWKVVLRRDMDELRKDLQDNVLFSSLLQQGLP
jgi:Cdc6-like AAA superfamily ATPase